MQKNVERVIIIVVTLIVCVVIQEVGLRMLGRSPTNMTDGFFKQHGDSYRLRKNIKKIVKWPSYTYTVYTNALGFRDVKTGTRDYSKKPLYAFLGTSQTFGNGVDYEKSFVGICAQQALRYGIETVNMGLQGAHLVEVEDILFDFIDNTGQSPEKAIVCFDPILMYKFDTDHAEVVVKSGYLFKKGKWLIPYIRIMLGNLSAAYCFFRDNFRKFQVQWFSSHEEKNFAFYDRLYSKNAQINDPEFQKRFSSRLTVFERRLREKGISPVYVYLTPIAGFDIKQMAKNAGKNPDNFDPEVYGNVIARHCKKKSIPFINFYPTLKKHHDNGERLCFVLDAHYNDKGNRITGDALANFLFSSEE